MPATPDTTVIAQKAVDLIAPDTVVGLGTGAAATQFIHALGARVQAGLQVRGIPTSDASAALARQLGIPLVTFDDVEAIDVCVDGADEVDLAGDLIKGYGGALLREKVVAAFSRKLVILVGPGKTVPALGTRGTLPVEVVPFALTPARRRIAKLGFDPQQRMKDGKPYVTDNGNFILDCKTGPLRDAAATDLALHAVPGVAGTGLFIKMAHTVMIQEGDKVEVRRGGAPE
ncbi:MAG: ribose-5-phosphate isomerase RpiA [Planctomycetes bacterium]|nr:ribose-5-phosphate isomerase RpiA [Planctomycetota bacterium]